MFTTITYSDMRRTRQRIGRRRGPPILALLGVSALVLATCAGDGEESAGEPSGTLPGTPPSSSAVAEGKASWDLVVEQASPTPSLTSPAPAVVVEQASPTPLPAPAVVSGSGLDGYIQTTFPAAASDWVGVQDVAVAPDGMVWGVNWSWSLVRFDGDTWRTYTPWADGLPHGLVRSVDVAPDGTVWVVADGGLARLDGETWTTVVTSSGGPGETAFGPDGSVVAAVDDRVVRFDGETWTTLTKPGTIPEWESVSSVAVDPVDGTVWVGTLWRWVGVGYILRFDGIAWTAWRVDELPGREAVPTEVVALTVASDGAVWAFLGDWTVARFEEGAWTVSPLPATDVPHSVLRAASMALGPDGKIWIGIGGDSDALVFSFGGNSWTMDRLGYFGCPLTIEPDGTLWVGVDASLVRLTPSED